MRFEYRQVWHCEKCNKNGHLSLIPDNYGVMEIIYRIEESHKEASPECDQSVYKLRIVSEVL